METGYRMKQGSRKDYLRKIHSRYQGASRSERGRILDEFCANCSYNRKYAIRLLNGRPPGSQPAGATTKLSQLCGFDHSKIPEGRPRYKAAIHG